MIGNEFPPRGSGVPGRQESAPSAVWAHPWQLGPSWDWKAGKLLLGKWQGRLIGRDDDRHFMTIAGSGAGKTTTMLINNLRKYPGGCVVLDPKGELARTTAVQRQRLGQSVYVLDPFGEVTSASNAYNPFEELGRGKAAHMPADAAQLTDALIVNNAKDPHWTDSSRSLLKGITLHLLSTRSRATLREVRRLLNATPAELERLFTDMTNSSAFDGIVANIGASFLGKKESGGRELQGILSTALTQTDPLDDIVHIAERSDFKLSELSKGKTTIYLVLPGMRMATHYRWLRLVIQQALGALERSPVPRGALPVWFVLEEFASLGHMRSIEIAAGLMRSFGVKLWPVLQDLGQLKSGYGKSFETFIGNCGLVQCFGNADPTTTEHISKMLGNTMVFERQDVRVSGQAMAHGDDGRREHIRSVPLLAANEITQHFSRETGRQLILMPGRPPIYLERLAIDE